MLGLCRLALEKGGHLRVIEHGVRTIKTTSTTHPQPQFDQEERVLEKIVNLRHEDLPTTLSNPYTKPERKCILCEHKITPDYKNVKLLYQFISPFTGMVYLPHVSGLCKEMYERVCTEIRKARSAGLMASYLKEPEFLKDPKICDPERPLKPHKY